MINFAALMKYEVIVKTDLKDRQDRPEDHELSAALILVAYFKTDVMDLRRIKLHQQQAVSRINFFLSGPYRFKKVIIITKTKNVIEIL